MINDLDNTLKTLLMREVGLEADAIRFEAPDASFAPPSQGVDLFLYDVRENRDLRSEEWLVERQSNGAVTKQRAPARVDCSYLITTWAGNIAGEHLLLGNVIRVLLRYPSLPAEVLQGGLAGQTPPLPTAVLQPSRLQSLGEFWQVLGARPKAVLHYTVTISVDVYPPVEAGLPVLDKQVPGKREVS